MNCCLGTTWSRGCKVLAIIPARGGSKGLPGKNIKPLCGKPLIAYTIEAALAAKSVERVILTTDDESIATAARKYGVEVPFMRPTELAQDDSSAVDVYRYTLERLNKGCSAAYDEFVVLQPTSPLRTASDIDAAIDLFRSRKADSVISVCEADHPPIWAKKIDGEGVLRDYFTESSGVKNRQKIPVAFMPNGAIYVLKSMLLDRGTYYSDRTFPYKMPVERSIDIDSRIDFDFAEFLVSRALMD